MGPRTPDEVCPGILPIFTEGELLGTKDDNNIPFERARPLPNHSTVHQRQFTSAFLAPAIKTLVSLYIRRELPGYTHTCRHLNRRKLSRPINQ